MKIYEVFEDKKTYLPLLLLADEQESMIDLYLDRGRLFALEEDKVVHAVCVVTDEGNGVLEIKNLAVLENAQREGYGRRFLDYIVENFHSDYVELLVGTGDSPLTLSFYESCGFEKSHVISNFFMDHYDEPIFEAGKQLIDMIYLKKKI